VWTCPTCGSNNEGAACWRCSAQPPAVTPGQPGFAPAAQPPPPLPPYPIWNPAPAPPTRSRWPVLLVAGLAVALLAGLAVLLVRPIVRLGAPTVALAAPATIAGVPKTADFSTKPVTVFGQHLLDVASATYGAGDVRYAVVAISGVAQGSDTRVLLQQLTPDIAGDDTLDQSSAAHLDRSGIGYSCWRMDGAVSGVTCTWNAGGVSGVVVQVGSADMGRCADFADVARTSLRHG
jgi:hypothetical protein